MPKHPHADVPADVALREAANFSLSILVGRTKVKTMSLNLSALTPLGWGSFYQQQLSPDELDQSSPCRVMAVHRGQLILSSGEQEMTIHLSGKMLRAEGDQQLTVGDWILMSPETGAFLRRLDRKNLIKRRAAGTDNSDQLVAANIDSLFIVTSCNDDFNLSRLERYLAFAHAAEVYPVIVITKKDKCQTPEDYEARARTLGPTIMVETINARDPEKLGGLKEWCAPGQTIALVGSSGVGKSTLANSLGAELQRIGEIRKDDAKGRHTTTHRSLLPLSGGALLLDSPGMRQLGLADDGAGVEAVFEEIAELARQCRFSDCQHDREPGCAVREALENGSLSPRRASNYTKLLAEQRHYSATVAERRKKDKAMGKFHKKVKAAKKSNQKF